MRRDLERRIEALEEGSGPIIDDLADFVRWEALGCPGGWRWDSAFEKQMEELAEKAKIE
jgi:hypothetical protein